MVKSFLKTLRKSQAEEGFTLTEIVVTLVIVGILAAIAIPIYSEQQKAAIREQVETDMMSTAQAFASWQQKQDNYNADPGTTVFNSKIAVKSDSATTVAYTSAGSATDPATLRYCITASKTIGGTLYQVYYETYTKVKGVGACPATLKGPTPETYS